jgi:methylated-DNA-protein-cysteine methyltransferase related protein
MRSSIMPGTIAQLSMGFVGFWSRRSLRTMTVRADRVLERVRAIPPGFVRAYSDLDPGAPRFAGAVLAANDDSELPWHRVVRADGSLPKGARQRARLDAEGVPFRGKRVDMRAARIPSGADVASA